MKNLIKLICIIVLTFSLNSCATFHLSTLNHDPVYTVEGSDVQVDVIDNEFELARLLRTDFRFRYDYAQYAMRQPITWHYQNRFVRLNTRYLGNVYGQYNRYYSYQNSWNMWNDWLWNYPYGNGIGWSYSWGNNHWSSNSWNSPYGWNNYYGWGNGHGWNQTHPYMYGRRGSRGRSNSAVYFLNSRSNRIVDSKVSTSESRTYLQTLRNLSNANRTIQRTKPRRTQTPIQPVVQPNRPARQRTVRNTQPTDNIRTLYPSGFKNANPQPTRSRPNSTRPVRQSVPQTTTKSSRKIKGN